MLAVGKAAPAMATAAENVLDDAISGGFAVAPAEGPPLRRVRLLTAGHPLPDGRGLRAAEQVEAFVRGAGKDDLVLVLLSGGASALLPAPAADVSLEDKARTTDLLLRAGTPIRELNSVRKHLSRLKGGGLARLAAPARVVTLALSDVVGDDPATIGSGPTAPDPSSFADALRVLENVGVADAVPAPVRRRLEAGARGGRRSAKGCDRSS
jgi:hydroxypyruvate reductase